MSNLPNWTLSQESRSRLAELLKSAVDFGLDPDAVAAGGLAALQALIALKRAKDAGDGAGEVPPLKWSILRYGFSKEDHDGKKEAYGGRDRCEVATG